MQAMEEKPAEVATLQQKFGVEAFHRFLGAYAAAQAKSGVATLRHLLEEARKLSSSVQSHTPTVAFERVAISLERDSKGQIKVHRRSMLLPLLPMLDGMDARRIGHCRQCGVYFYATRLLEGGRAPEGCPLHTDSLRQRRYRERRDYYNRRRKVQRKLRRKGYLPVRKVRGAGVLEDR